MDFERLDPFSREMANRLFAKYPDWRRFARAEKAENGTAYLSVTVPAPAEAHADHDLTITTSGAKVTIGFDYYHCHFHAAVGDGEHFGADYAFHFIDRLLNERIAVISWWQGNEWRAFSIREGGVNVMPDDLVGPSDRQRIRSWRGSLNADNAA